MKCYVLNLDRSRDRYDEFLDNFSHTKLEVERIVAVEGRALSKSCPEFSVWRYQYFHGQHFNGSVFGCTMSHLKAMKTFLSTEDSRAMICEDDVIAIPELDDVLAECMRYRKSWDLLRLNALRHRFHSIAYARLDETYSLCRFFGWFPGTGAYVVNRPAAEILLKKAYPFFCPPTTIWRKAISLA